MRHRFLIATLVAFALISGACSSPQPNLELVEQTANETAVGAFDYAITVNCTIYNSGDGRGEAHVIARLRQGQSEWAEYASGGVASGDRRTFDFTFAEPTLSFESSQYGCGLADSAANAATSVANVTTRPTATSRPSATAIRPTATPRSIATLTTGSHRLTESEVRILFQQYAEQAPGVGFTLFSCWGQATGMDNVFRTDWKVEARPDSPGVWVVTSTVESSAASPVTHTWTYRESTGIFVGPC